MQTKLEAEVEQAGVELMEGLKNVKFFRESLERIKRDFPGKYVVIKNQQIIDSDLECEKLKDKYIGQNVLITSYFDTLNEYLESPLADSPNEYN